MKRLVASLPTPIEVNTIDHHHAGVSPISGSFRPPNLPKKLTFNLIALAASIARTETLRRVSDRTRFFLGISTFIEAGLLIENGPYFTLSPDFRGLADAARRSFAGSVGAGIADLVMNQLGYTWRDNAESLFPTNSPHPDFIYGDGPAAGHGIVIVEAHGSFAKDITLPTIKKRTRNKFARQVVPNLTSCHPQYGNVMNGYCIGFGSRPNRSGSFLCVADTSAPVTQPSGSSSGDPEAENPSTPLVLATCRSNFSLLGAMEVVRWIEWILFDIDEFPDDVPPVKFPIIGYVDKEFVVSPIFHRFFPSFYYEIALENFGLFAIAKQSCQSFLNYLTRRINRDESTEFPDIPKSEIAGFSSTELRDTEYVMYRDGLALLGNPSKMESEGRLIWDPRRILVWDPHNGCRIE